jgi:hypothetical protein
MYSYISHAMLASQGCVRAGCPQVQLCITCADVAVCRLLPAV